MLSVLDLITDALTEINVYSPGEPLEAAVAQLALRNLNRVIDSANTDAAKIFTTRIDTYALQTGKQSYTIGADPSDDPVTPDLAGPRPVRIKEANVVVQTDFRVPVGLITDEQWAAKRIQKVQSIPREMYNDGGFPLSTLFFYPIPAEAYGLELYTWQSASKVASLSDGIDYPPGYEDYWLASLALRLCTPFGKAIPQELVERQRKAEANIQSLNTESPRIGTAAKGRRGFNYLTRES